MVYKHRHLNGEIILSDFKGKAQKSISFVMDLAQKDSSSIPIHSLLLHKHFFIFTRIKLNAISL